jgi:hypothetical protein
MKDKGYFGFYFVKEIHASDNKEHNRLIGHNVYVSKIIHPRWNKTKKLIIPEGALEKVCKLDMGQIFMDLEKGEPIFEEEILEKNKIHYFSDGSYLVGDHKRKKFCDPYKEEFFRRYLDLSFDIDKKNDFGYTFFIKKDLFDSVNPIVFCVEKYVIIDEKVMPMQEFEFIKPVFEQKNGEMKFKSLRKYARKFMPWEVESLFA